MMTIEMRTILVPLGFAGLVAVGGCTATNVETATTAQVATDSRPTFRSPEEAIQALAKFAASGGADGADEIFGPGGTDLAQSGDPVADRNAALEVKRMIDEKVAFEDIGDDTKVAVLGDEDWPFPVPLVSGPGGWRFDTETGREEVENRRIGRNELTVLATLHAAVDAQMEYFAGDHGGRPGTYAQRFLSTEGMRDGLYWPTGEDEEPSPLGPLIAEATGEGYSLSNAEPSPYHGYFFHLLTAQGPSAPGGAMSYLDADGEMTKGFAILAWPAEHGDSGVMTFIVNERGLVFQKDLGPETNTAAAAIAEFDPDETWDPTGD
jgi:hypothetical protein